MEKLNNLTTEIRKNELVSNETEKMARIGGWEYDLATEKIYWSREVYAIYGLSLDVDPDILLAVDAYLEPYKHQLQVAIQRAIEDGESYEFELQLRQASGKVLWVRALGKPVISEDGAICGLRGTLQDIDEEKKKQIQLQQSVIIISEQNKRLLNFAHIVSHNLRSHSGNLKTLLELIRVTTDQEEREVFIGYLNKLSDSLGQTIEHLADVIKIQTEIKTTRKSIQLEDVLDDTISILAPTLDETNAIIDADFTGAPEIEYVQAYIESIMLNLVSNAVKYRHPDRAPEILIRSFSKNGKTIMTVADNGLGIDLVKVGDHLFGMYQTFHENKDARGIGLFITKNQVEAMGGTVSVESTPDKGSVFIVEF